MTPFEHNERIAKDLFRYGTIILDIRLKDENVRMTVIQTKYNEVWFVRKQNGTTYDCLNCTEGGFTKHIIYGKEE